MSDLLGSFRDYDLIFNWHSGKQITALTPGSYYGLTRLSDSQITMSVQ